MPTCHNCGEPMPDYTDILCAKCSFEAAEEKPEEIRWQDQPGRDRYFVTKGATPDTYTIHRRCPFCGELSHVTVPGPGLWAWEHGEFVQRAFPTLSASEREQVLTGSHGTCWDR